MDSDIEDLPFPFQYMCPITQNLMKDPVITVDGHTFDRQVILQWFNTGHITNPLTNKPISSTQLIPNRSLKSLICSFRENASGSGLQLENINKYKAKHLVFNINQELAKKFPKLVDQFGMVKIYKLQQILKENELLKIENQKLQAQIQKQRAEIYKQRKQINYYLPQLYSNGSININYINKIQKQQKSLRQQNQELSEKLKSIGQQLYAQQEQKNLIMSLMNASQEQGLSLRIEQPWYDEAAVALNQIVVPPITLFLHITESNFKIRKKQKFIESARILIQNIEQHFIYAKNVLLICNVVVLHISITECNFDLHHRVYSNLIIECTLQDMQGVIINIISEKFAKALVSQQLAQLTQLTLKIQYINHKISHDLFDSQDIKPVVEAINILPKLKKFTVIVDPLFTVNDKNWTNHIAKNILVQVVVK